MGFPNIAKTLAVQAAENSASHNVQDAFELGWLLVELKSRIELQQMNYKKNEDPTRLQKPSKGVADESAKLNYYDAKANHGEALLRASVWGAQLNAIANLCYQYKLYGSTEHTLFDPPPDKNLCFLYPAPNANLGGAYTDFSIPPLIITGAGQNQPFQRQVNFDDCLRLYEVIRRALGCLSLLYMTEDDSLIWDTIHEHQKDLLTALESDQARKILDLSYTHQPGGSSANNQTDQTTTPSSAQADQSEQGGSSTRSEAQPSSPTVPSGNLPPAGCTPPAVASTDPEAIRLYRAISQLSYWLVTLMDSLSSYIRSQWNMQGITANNHIMQESFEAGVFVAGISWDIAVERAKTAANSASENLITRHMISGSYGKATAPQGQAQGQEPTGTGVENEEEAEKSTESGADTAPDARETNETGEHTQTEGESMGAGKNQEASGAGKVTETASTTGEGSGAEPTPLESPWKNRFCDKDVIRAQHLIGTLSQALDDVYTAGHPAAANTSDGNSSVVVFNPELPSACIQAVKSSLDYWQRSVAWLTNKEYPPIWRVGSSFDENHEQALFSALVEQADIWHSLIVGKQQLSNFTLESISKQIESKLVAQVGNLALQGIFTGERDLAEQANQLVKEAEKEVQDIAETASSGFEEILTHFKWIKPALYVSAGAIVLVLLAIVLAVIFLPSGKGGGAAAGVVTGGGFAAGLASLAGIIAGWLGINRASSAATTTNVDVQQKKTSDGSAAPAADQGGISITEVITHVETKAGGILKQVEDTLGQAYQRGVQQVRMDVRRLDYNLGISYPLVEFFLLNTTLKSDLEFLRRVVFTAQEEADELDNIIGAAFGPLGLLAGISLDKGNLTATISEVTPGLKTTRWRVYGTVAGGPEKKWNLYYAWSSGTQNPANWLPATMVAQPGEDQGSDGKMDGQSETRMFTLLGEIDLSKEAKSQPGQGETLEVQLQVTDGDKKVTSSYLVPASAVSSPDQAPA